MIKHNMAVIDQAKIDLLKQSFQDRDARLADPAVANDSSKLMRLSQDRAKLAPVIELIETRASVISQLEDIDSQLGVEKDQEFLVILKEEKAQLKAGLVDIEQKLEFELLPKDPNAGKNVFVEIRAGTGGDEAALFAKDLFRMYTRFCEKKQVKVEMMRSTEIGINGLKEVVFLASGATAYELLHFESGTHRVQRIPETESGGRLHTSACTVAVIPEVEEQEFEINANDLRIDIYRSSGPGGQSVNTTDSAVRITHVPTGVVVSCQDEKSQHKNKAKAMQVLRARVKEKQDEENKQKSDAEKKAQIGSGDRSEKIRTYNFPQNRLTDHRINFSSHGLDKCIDGDLDEVIDELLKHERKKFLESTKGV